MKNQKKSLIKLFLLIGFIVCMFICRPPVTIYADDADWSKVYNTDYYYENNPDVAAAFGMDAEALFEHFVHYGIYEGRQANDSFNVEIYKCCNSDLESAFGDSMEKYYYHYMNYGCDEERITSQDGLRLIFDSDYYKNRYGDVYAVYGDNANALACHFIKYGAGEARRGNADFDVFAYKTQNPDLSAAFGEDWYQYYMHYVRYGASEGRSCQPYSIYDGVNYCAVYNKEYYYGHNEDLQEAFGDDAEALLNHFVQYGMKEGRQASGDFNVSVYRDNNADLAEAFGNDLEMYYRHFMQYGYAEDRTHTTDGSEWTLTQYECHSRVQGMFYTLVSDSGQVIVIDGGLDDNTAYVREVIQQLGNHVSAWILTHPHPDHIGVFNEIYKNPDGIVIDCIYDSPIDYAVYDENDVWYDEINYYQEYLNITSGDKRIHSLYRGDDFSLMGLQVSVFNGYDDNVVSNSTDICNDGGLIFRVSSAHTSMLFCADVSTAMEDTILSEYRDRLASDYVQMGHHGNSTFSFDFYDAVGAVGAFYDAPDWLVTGESYTTQKYIRYMQEKGADVYLWYTAPNEVKLN